jgi:hypothetical protein
LRGQHAQYTFNHDTYRHREHRYESDGFHYSYQWTNPYRRQANADTGSPETHADTGGPETHADTGSPETHADSNATSDTGHRDHAQLLVQPRFTDGQSWHDGDLAK